MNKIKISGTGFTSPKGYFELLEDRIGKTFQDLENSETKDLDNKVKVQKLNDSPSLDQIERNHGFTVPKGYFDQVESKLTVDKNPKVISLDGRNLRVFYLSIAASILVFFGIQYMNNVQSDSGKLVLQDEEIANWIEADLVSFNSIEIAEAFSDVELEDPLYTDEEVYNYLNYIDIENLIIEN